MRKQIIIYIFALFVGLVIGFFVGNGSEKPNGNNLSNVKNKDDEKNIEYRSGGYQFISPLLECDSGQNLYQGQTAALKEKLKKFNDEYQCVEYKKSPFFMGKKVAWWIDLDLIQDTIDRMNSRLCDDSDEYIINLKKFLNI